MATLINPEHQERFVEAVLAPLNSGTQLGVWTQKTYIGTIKHPEILLNSQLLRIFASGHLIGCKLHLTPSRGVLASIMLPDLDFAVIMNKVPHSTSSLLAGGTTWQVEPTANSPFKNFLPRSAVILELHEMQSVLTVFYNGTECGVLDIETADALSSAVRYSYDRGVHPLVRGYVTRTDASVSIEIDALPLELWSKKQRRLQLLEIPTLVSYHQHPESYREGTRRLSQALFECSKKKKALSFADKALKYSPYVTLAAGGTSLVASAFISQSRLSYFIIGLILAALTTVVLFAKNLTGHSQFWNLFSSVGLMASLPAFIFVSANNYLGSADVVINTEESTIFTTLANAPLTPSDIPTTPASVPDSLGSTGLQGETGAKVFAFENRNPPVDSTRVPSVELQISAPITSVSSAPPEFLSPAPSQIPSTSEATVGGNDNNERNDFSPEEAPTLVATPPPLLSPPTFIKAPPPPPLDGDHVGKSPEPTEPIESTKPPESIDPSDMSAEPSTTSNFAPQKTDSKSSTEPQEPSGNPVENSEEVTSQEIFIWVR